MPICNSCGIEIPSGQTNCSVCYGDIDYGRDGHYRRLMEREAQREQERRDYDKCIEQQQEDHN